MPKSLEVFSLSNVPRVIRGETLLGTVVRVVLWFSLSSCTSMDIPDSVQEPITHINPEQTLIAYYDFGFVPKNHLDASEGYLLTYTPAEESQLLFDDKSGFTITSTFVGQSAAITEDTDLAQAKLTFEIETTVRTKFNFSCGNFRREYSEVSPHKNITATMLLSEVTNQSASSLIGGDLDFSCQISPLQ
jgi:hypothetical protein